ncbi:hypothetical protein ACIN8IBEIGE_120155 [Acinetobacter sp. 8I-beige]|nr:hypothetical protein ACIN8IBEIGE_120155 [Acinetobacter sp. 8I-beige]
MLRYDSCRTFVLELIFIVILLEHPALYGSILENLQACV